MFFNSIKEINRLLSKGMPKYLVRSYYWQKQTSSNASVHIKIAS